MFHHFISDVPPVGGRNRLVQLGFGHPVNSHRNTANPKLIIVWIQVLWVKLSIAVNGNGPGPIYLSSLLGDSSRVAPICVLPAMTATWRFEVEVCLDQSVATDSQSKGRTAEHGWFYQRRSLDVLD
jgi:hypothetical protein